VGLYEGSISMQGLYQLVMKQGKPVGVNEAFC
jgi:hypothetical protein